MQDYLQKYLGVPDSQIRNLRDREATRAAIIEEIKAFSLDENIKEGDPILIYYAGHGSWAKIPDGWVGSTGKIQLLIPHDHSSPLNFSNPKHGIPDRTLGALLSHLASKKGDNITVILDCCHSGSATRWDLSPRAIDIENVQVPSDLDQEIWSVIESSKYVERGAMIKSGFAREGLRSHVLLAACHSQESAYERLSSLRGVFTKALLETFKKIGIDKLTYATLFDLQMPTFPPGQNPQCEGFNKDRIIFDGKAPGKRTIYYKIRKSEGKTYVMPDAGEAAGITVGAEFEVYQDLYSGHLLGTVFASELSPFSTTLHSKEKSGFPLDRDGVAFKSCPGTKEQLRIHVADQSLKDLVRKIDPNQRIIKLVERDRGAEFGIALENGKAVFNIYDSDVTKYGLTRIPYILEPTFEALSTVIRAAAHFYWHRRRAPQADRGLADFVEVKATKLKQKSVGHDKRLKEKFDYVPTDWNSEKESPQTKTSYGWKITNKCKVPLYPALFYFDNSDWSIKPYYEPPIARGTVEPPLKGERSLTVGYGDSGSVPYTYFLREGQKVDVGILKLFLSRNQVNLSHVAQPSPFQTSTTGTPHSPCTIQVVMPEPMVNLSHIAPSQSSPSHDVSTPTTGLSSRGSKPLTVPEPKDLPLPWDTIEISLFQQPPDK